MGPNMFESRAGHASIFVKPYIYIIGGVKTNFYNSTTCCERIHVDQLDENNSYINCTHDKLQPSNFVRTGASVTAFEGGKYIYLFGGYHHSNEISNCIERYSINEDKWEIVKVCSENDIKK